MMSAFCVPTPCIIPLRLPTFGESKCIDDKTKIEILCETEVEVYYTLDGTKPQPYVGIVQGSKTHKYAKPFCLSPGKITIRALAIHPVLRTMCSSVITKTLYVEKKIEPPKPKIALVNVQLPNSENTKVNDDKQSNDYNVDHNVDGEDMSSPNGEDKLEIGTNSPEDEEIAPTSSRPAEDEPINGSESEEDEVLEDSSGISQLNQETDIDVGPLEEDVPDVETEYASHHCIPVEMAVQHCLACNKMNNLLSRYCDNCGEKLYKECTGCNERNPGIAKFCQFCGDKFKSLEVETELQLSKVEEVKEQQSIGILVKPDVGGRSTNTLAPSVVTQSVQTYCVEPEKTKKRLKKTTKQVSASTPGQGYWRQQLDYVCNHLKAYSNNNHEFQKLIGTPPLGKFISADVSQNEGKVSISITFADLSQKNDSPSTL